MNGPRRKDVYELTPLMLAIRYVPSGPLARDDAFTVRSRDMIGVIMAAGVYVLFRNGRRAYVGRGDTDVDERHRKSRQAARYDLTSLIYDTTSARQAFLLECRLWHKHWPCDNQRHPARPRGTIWHCPVRGCEYH